MNVEVLKPENTRYLEQYEALGFKSKNHMVEEAIEMLRVNLDRFPRLSNWQLRRIQDARKDLEEGNYLTNEQVDDMVDEWLKT